MKHLKFIAFVLALFAPFWSKAQMPDVVKWQVYADNNDGNSAQIVAVAEILSPGWHFWTLDLVSDALIPTQIEIDQKELLDAHAHWQVSGNVIQKEDEIFGPIEYYDGDQIIFRKSTKAPAGSTITGEITFQACNESTCLPPKTIPFEVKID